MTEEEFFAEFMEKLMDEEKVPPHKRSEGCAMAAPEAMTWEQAISMASKRYGEAKAKHPEFAHGAWEGYLVIADEMLELKYAVRNESRQRQIDEALDVVVTCLRFIMGEHGA